MSLGLYPGKTDFQLYWKSLVIVLSMEAFVELEGEALELLSEESVLLFCSCP